MKSPTQKHGQPGSRRSANPFLEACRCFLEARSPAGMLCIGVALIGLIGALDYVTGPQISSSLFYLIPVLVVTRFAGAGIGVVVAFIASGVWLLADLLPPALYDHSWIPFWNAIMRLGVFLVTVRLVATMRSLNAHLDNRVKERTAALEAEVQERKQLERKVLEISDREQARIGQDLHDGLCQHLVSTAFSANMLQQQLAVGGRPEAKSAGQISALLDDSITQARNLARGLYPVRVEAEGLATALQELATHTSRRFEVTCSFVYDGKANVSDTATAIHLYRIAQEAVMNAAKHARSRNIVIGLAAYGTRVRLTVEDDGVGISATPADPGGMGLRIMNYRARMIGGTFEIARGKQGGTLTICQL